MRNLLGSRDDLQSVRESIGIGRLEARVGEFGLGSQHRCTTCSGEAPLEHALASQVAGLVEAFEQLLEVTVTRDQARVLVGKPREILSLMLRKAAAISPSMARAIG
jgi:hypothetical protein